MQNEQLVHLATETNNQVWNYLQKETLVADDRTQMLATAYTSLYLWIKANGTPLHLARANWVICRVCCVLEEGALALTHAQLCERYTDQAKDKQDFDEGYKLEAYARAYALNKDSEKSQAYRKEAADLGAKIADPEDKKIFLGDLESGPWF